ncbi:hypothetical protein HZB88_03525, partial [archaeon]|nr:hypothetical protein [archaeon]
FIIVNDNFDSSYIPLGYMLIDMKYKGDSFKTLVPQSLLFFLANPGEGDVDDALDEISDFYGNVQDFEDDLLEENGNSVQGTNWAVTARTAYATYLINKLTKPKGENADNPEWNKKTLKALDINDKFVARRIKAMAAVRLEKTAEEVRNYGLGDVLKHITVNERKVEQLSREEFDQITCWAGSHYKIKEEYQNNPDVEYRIDSKHSIGHKVGEKITKRQDVPVLDAKINQLEEEIQVYRKGKHDSLGRHDKMLIRMYANLVHIAKENSQKQLEIKPSAGQEYLQEEKEEGEMVLLTGPPGKKICIPFQIYTEDNKE